MKISSRFTVAVHCLLYIACAEKVTSEKVTSDKIAASVNTNPVVIRKLLGKLKQANLIKVYAGTGGTAMLKNPTQITLLDIYRIAEVVDDHHLFNLHESNPECPIGKEITGLLDKPLHDAQQALENSLSKTTLADLIIQIHKTSSRQISRSSISTILL